MEDEMTIRKRKMMTMMMKEIPEIVFCKFCEERKLSRAFISYSRRDMKGVCFPCGRKLNYQVSNIYEDKIQLDIDQKI